MRGNSTHGSGHFRRLYAYDAWANRRTLDACAALTPEQFTQDLGSSFRSVRDTLVHIFGAEWIWLERFQGRSPTALPGRRSFRSRQRPRALDGSGTRSAATMSADFTPADLDRVLEYRNMKGKCSAQPLWQMLQHVANHGSYHRGQVTTLLRQLGAQPG